MSSWDVVVIGSGISSLTCALLLARTGKRVCVLERHTKFGGYLHNFSRYGETFDTGGHYMGALGPDQPFQVLLKYLGVYDGDDYAPLALDGFDVLKFPSFKIVIPNGYENVVRELSAAFPFERTNIERYFALVRDAVQYFPTYTFSANTVNQEKLLPLLETSLGSVVESLFTDDRLKCVLYAYTGLHGVAPEDVSFGLNALVLDSLIRGAYGFRHGGDRLATRFVEKIKQHGGDVLTRVNVTAIVSDGEKITGVETGSHGTFTGDLVVSGIHPKQTFRMLQGAKLTPAFKSRMSHIKESIGLLGIYGTCSVRPGLDANRNYYAFGTEDPKFFSLLANPPASPDDMPNMLFVSRPDRLDDVNRTAFPLTIHAPAPFSWFAKWQEKAMRRKTRDYYLFKFELAKKSLTFLESEFPRTFSVMDRFDVSTPLSNLRFNGSEDGSAYGIYHSMRNTGIRALGPMTHLKNLMITGQSCLFPGMMGAAISGLRTAGNVVGIKPILKDLQQMGNA